MDDDAKVGNTDNRGIILGLLLLMGFLGSRSYAALEVMNGEGDLLLICLWIFSMKLVYFSSSFLLLKCGRVQWGRIQGASQGLESCRRSSRVCRIICIQSDCGVCERRLMSVEREQRFPFSSWKITFTNEVRSYVFLFVLGIFGKTMNSLWVQWKNWQRKQLQQWCKVWGSDKQHTLVRELQESLKKKVISWIMHGSRLDLDMMHSWKESSCWKTGGYVSSFCHWIPSPKKIRAIHDILFVFMHMGWLAWIAVMMRFWRQIVWTVNKVQAFSAAMGICGCNYRRAQVLHL